MSDALGRFSITKIAGSDEIALMLVPSVRQFMNALHRRAQRLAPKRTWRLHDSLESDVERDGRKVVGTLVVGGNVNGVEVDYWQYVEYGTSRQSAQPYMRPALLQSRSADLTYQGQPTEKHGTPSPRRGAR